MDRKKDFLRLVVGKEVSDNRIKGVYLVTDQGEHLVERVREALTGGVGIVQYRDKGSDRSHKLAECRELLRLCREAGVPLIINDDVELARQVHADGVHLGQEDGDPVAARTLLGPEKIVGVSTHSVEEAVRAEAAGADYIGFGAMYPTVSKTVTHLPGPAGLAAIKASVGIPVVAIGGINRNNAARVLDSGADAVAVITAILDHPEPALAAAELQLLFNRRRPYPRGTVLTIAGSDSGGGAGIQADLKTITLLGSYGASVITALTAQNTRGVTGVHPPPASFVGEQLDAVLSDISIDVIKTGMLFSPDTVRTVAEKIRLYHRRFLVVDPVMRAKGGTNLMDGPSLAVLKRELLPLTYLLTPNVPEAEKMTGMTITDENDMEQAARILHGMGARNVLIKGGHLPTGDAVDLLFDGSSCTTFSGPRFLSKNTHGTGCTFASAIASFLAQGEPLLEAISRSKSFISAAIRLAAPLGKGHGPVNHFLASREQFKN